MTGIGIIGCGKITQVRHVPEYLDNPRARIIGVTDMNAKRAEELAGKIGCKTYASAQELLDDPEIQAVSVCTANFTHAELSIAALRAGKHVLCEKPMATTLQECEDMVREADKTGKILMIGQNQRLTKAHVRAKQLLRNGAIGRVVTFRTTFGHGGPETWSIDPGRGVWFFDKTRSVMGAMADLGIHKTDLIQFLLDDHVTRTQAILATLDKKDAKGNPIGVDDNAICIYTMKSGVIGTMTASWTYYGKEDNSTVLYGTEGIMRIYDDPDYSISITKKNGEEELFKIDAIQTNDNQTKSGVIDAFIESVEDGVPPQISGKSVLPAMKAVFASIRSSQSGKAVDIDEEK
jgi:predicted dehydrogenase